MESKKQKRRKAAGVIMSSGGVAGSGVVRIPNSVPNPAEVKYSEGGFTSPAAGTAGAWCTLNNLLVSNITQGVGTNNRVGKNIRVVGVLYRIAINYFTTGAGDIPLPYTVDFLWDKKPTATSASIQEMYDSGAAGGSILSTILPNPNYETRFLWQKRIEKAPQNNQSLTAGSFKCNKFVSYSGNTGGLLDIEQNNLIVNFGHAASDTVARATLQGRIRVLFVDA